jgi:hypothetical protein
VHRLLRVPAPLRPRRHRLGAGAPRYRADLRGRQRVPLLPAVRGREPALARRARRRRRRAVADDALSVSRVAIGRTGAGGTIVLPRQLLEPPGPRCSPARDRC